MSRELVGRYEMRLVTPECHPGSDRYSLFLDLQNDITEALPYLNAELGGFDYRHDNGILLWSHDEKTYAFRPHEIAITPVLDHAEARQCADRIIETVNDIWSRRNEITPNFEGKKPLPNVLDIYKLLPRTNCKECGFPTCMAFAVALRTDSAKSSLCPRLSEDR